MNFRSFATTLLSLTLFSALPAADAHEAHVHGVGKLDIVLDGEVLSLHLDTPLANLLGFEHPPTSDAERASVKRATAQLRAADHLFLPTAAAQCHLLSVSLEAPTITAYLGNATVTQHAATAPVSEHADLEGDFIFTCAKPAALRTLEVKLFEQFKGFQRINVQLVTPAHQAAATLQPQSSVVEF
ncbi:DUF2796 domain-containing protein [Herbaspirillum sp. RTI4]|uniref:DUF2796 domain-containing protein n=1 Tax=Herbaspirillum sp. RTI4 TaxID=3048640 RepID=UPI002AB51EAA|nr:DUF2796 domain-containing protein [Herbaspirillum sp. RTI4]MDY7579325.1 DUF2796 domain-containing protein [Herbaspirillum sp. RTI4]MEA9980239.1 DUF2796 domain-containing protein [Herbaspirillum sp. RTI4]